MSSAVSDFLTKAIDRVFHSHHDISYIAAVDGKLKVIAQKGFIDLHPSKLNILHVQAALLVGMSSVWSESLGRLDYTFASFNSKSEILVMPITENVHVLVVLSHANKKDLETIRESIVTQFKSAQVAAEKGEQ